LRNLLIKTTKTVKVQTFDNSLSYTVHPYKSIEGIYILSSLFFFFKTMSN